jgi:hypothetical protein
MPDMSQYEADYPGVTPAWWRAKETHFPRNTRPHFDSFHQALTRYTVTMSPENMSAVVDSIDRLVIALNTSKTTTIIPRLLAVQEGPDRPRASESLRNLKALLKPITVPKQYQV